MSTHYDLVPLAELCINPKKVKWLEEMGLTLPQDWQTSRHPTPEEVRIAVTALVSEGSLRCEQDFQIAGDDLDTLLRCGNDETILSVSNYANDMEETKPHRVSFQHGDGELVFLIAERLARLCGPFLLTMDWAFFTIVAPEANGQWVMDDF